MSLQLPLTLTLRSSRALVVALSATHGLALLAVVLAQVPTLVRGALVAGVALSAALAYRRSRWTPEALTIHSDSTLRVHLADGQVLDATLGEHTRVLPSLVTLDLCAPGFRRSLLILPDMAHADDLRALRVWARTRGALPG